ncbi:hypothetical protein POM88_042751 [Heracleum sosnowskyi]|uniref:Uncharacterized protein n=1 Tax=Heracleum sosnowskyi TaxID=360622 RepID=A0AAD8HH24_9APIA|nr:hypothetical protein POM88_042751 [Heracleum sosnowskyi]
MLKYLHELQPSQEGSASHPSVGSKLTSSVMNEYRASYDMGNDGEKHTISSRIKIGKGRKESTKTWERKIRKESTKTWERKIRNEAISVAVMRAAKNQCATRKKLKSVIGRGRIFQKIKKNQRREILKETHGVELTKRFHKGNNGCLW